MPPSRVRACGDARTCGRAVRRWHARGVRPAGASRCDARWRCLRGAWRSLSRMASMNEGFQQVEFRLGPLVGFSFGWDGVCDGLAHGAPVHAMLFGQSQDLLAGRVAAPEFFEQFHFRPPVHPGILSSGAVQVGQIRGAKWAKLEARTHGGSRRFRRRGGTISAPAFPPEGETGKGASNLIAAAGYFFVIGRQIPHCPAVPLSPCPTGKQEFAEK
jgi:hypothetical protein